ncbi:MAG TPA: carboxypeptidase-like regulatory domain-containing protein [Pyrinomonadaceae bacterium]|nr:carboxypeptidase-like regulatory domain-containing protein [Pyrinomonadaceae bacterium]
MCQLPRIHKALTLAAMLVCCASVLAQTRPQASSSATPAAAEEPTVGVITGSVVNESGQPLAGVRVSVREVSGVAARNSMTDAEGNFRINGLGPALYFVSAYYPAHVTPPTDTVWPFTYYRAGDSVRLEMMRGGVITGTVLNATGDPVIGVRVRAVMVRTAKGEPPRGVGASYQERTTDDRGVYRLFGLPTGTYLVSAGGSTSTQVSNLNPYDTDLPTYSPSSTRDAAGEISLRAGEEVTADIRYRGEPGHSISGTMKVTGPSNGSIALTVPGGTTTIANAFQMPMARGFHFPGVPDGEYEIVATELKQAPPQSGTPPSIFVSEPKRVVVKGADVTGLELVTRPLASISGRVVLEATKVAACEGKRRPLFTEMLVALQRPEKENTEKAELPYLRMFPSPASPDANGSFMLRNLSPGRYLPDPRFYARYWYLSSISIPATPKIDPAANWTTLKFGDQVTNFTITLAEGAASIRGRLKPADDGAIPSGLGVYLIPAEQEKTADVLRYFITTIQADGTFSLNNLPPGRYLTLVQSLDAQMNTLAKLRLPESAETRTKLRRAAESQKANLELKPCQNLTDFELKQ